MQINFIKEFYCQLTENFIISLEGKLALTYIKNNHT